MQMVTSVVLHFNMNGILLCLLAIRVVVKSVVMMLHRILLKHYELMIQILREKTYRHSFEPSMIQPPQSKGMLRSQNVLMLLSGSYGQSIASQRIQVILQSHVLQ